MQHSKYFVNLPGFSKAASNSEIELKKKKKFWQTPHNIWWWYHTHSEKQTNRNSVSDQNSKLYVAQGFYNKY